MINPEWLRYFVAIAESLNLREAADTLHISPQALSLVLGKLEAYYQTPLLLRDRRLKGLTPAGKVLFAEAKAALLTLENLDQQMADLRNQSPKGPVRLGCVGFWQAYLLPGILSELIATHPRIRPQIYNMLPEDVERGLLAGDLDIGLLQQEPLEQELEWVCSASTPYVIVARPQPPRPWSEFGYLVPGFFQRELGRSLDGWFEPQYRRRVVAEVSRLDTAIQLCIAGVGAAYLPKLAVDPYLAKGELAIVSEAPFQNAEQLIIATRPGVRHGAATRELLNRLLAEAG